MGEIRYFIVDGNYQFRDYVDRSCGETVMIESRGGLYCYRDKKKIFSVARNRTLISTLCMFGENNYWCPKDMPEFLRDLIAGDLRNKQIASWILFNTELFLGTK